MENKYIGYCEEVVKGICQFPEKVEVKKTVDEMGVLLTITVDREDMRTVVGKGGATADAIRRILRVAGALESAKVAVKISDSMSASKPEPGEVIY